MLGTQELILIFLAIILLFGASKLPELARSLGKSSGEFKKAQMEVEKEIQQLEEPVEKTNEISQNILKLAKDLRIDINGKDENAIIDEIKSIIQKNRIITKIDQ